MQVGIKALLKAKILLMREAMAFNNQKLMLGITYKVSS